MTWFRVCDERATVPIPVACSGLGAPRPPPALGGLAVGQWVSQAGGGSFEGLSRAVRKRGTSGTIEVASLWAAEILSLQTPALTPAAAQQRAPILTDKRAENQLHQARGGPGYRCTPAQVHLMQMEGDFLPFLLFLFVFLNNIYHCSNASNHPTVAWIWGLCSSGCGGPQKPPRVPSA